MDLISNRVLLWREKMASWVRTVARRASTRFHSAEDLEQEGDIQIWKCLRVWHDLGRDPVPPNSEFVGMIKACFCKRLASLLGQQRSKRNFAELNLEIDFRTSHEHPEHWYQQKIQELIVRCEDPKLKKWIQKNLMPGSRRSGMTSEEYGVIKDLVEQVF